MDQIGQAAGAAPAAAPPAPVDASALQAVPGQPGEPQAGASPEAAPQQQEQPFEYRTADGSVYKTIPAALASLDAKSEYINRLESLLRQQQQPAQPAQPQANPREQFMAQKTAALAQRFQTTASDPFVVGMAEELWETRQETQQAAQRQIRQIQHAEFQNIKAADPRFDPGRQDAYGFMVRGIAAANPNGTPSQHYQIFQQQVRALGGGAAQQTPMQPQVPGYAQNLFDAPGRGSSGPALPPQDPPELFSAIEANRQSMAAKGQQQTPQDVQYIRDWYTRRIKQLQETA